MATFRFLVKNEERISSMAEAVMRRRRRYRRSGALFCLVTIAFLLVVSPLIGAVAPTQAPIRASKPRGEDIVRLPYSLRKNADRIERKLDRLIAKPNDLHAIQLAIPRAESDLALRRKYQGDAWWQTADARRRLADLLQLQKLTQEQRADLTMADSMASEVADIPIGDRLGKQKDAIAKAFAAANLFRNIWGDDEQKYASCLDLIAEYYHDLGAYKDAEPIYVQVLHIRLSILGDQHPDYAISLNNLAELYVDTGRYLEAEPYYLESLEVFKRTGGENSSDDATELNNLAALYRSLGQYEKAESYAKRAVSIDAKQRGSSDFADSLYPVALKTLAEIRQDLGRFSSAEQLLRQVFAIDAKSPGKNHPSYAIDLNDLASLYKQMGKPRDALPLEREAVRIVEKTLGEQNKTYTADISNLAGIEEDLGHFERAERLYQKALTIDRDVLGESHSEYADDLNNLAGLYETLGRFAEALPLYLQALNITRTSLGEAQPVYALRLNNLAELYEATGLYGKAEPLFQQALDIRARFLGEGHPDYATSLNNLAELYDGMKRYDEARPLLEKALAIRGRALGKLHPDYASSLNNLGGLYKSLHLFEQAEPLYLEAREINRRVYGELSWPYAQILGNLAILYSETSQHNKAIQIDRETLKIARSVLGADSVESALSLNNLAEEYAAKHEYQEAERSLRDAIVIDRKALGEESPEYAGRLTNLSLILAAQGKWAEVSRLLDDASSIKWKHLVSNLGFFSPEQQQRWLQTDAFREAELIWSCAFDGHATATEALQAVLWRKQLGIETSRQQSAALRSAISSGSPSWQHDWKLLAQRRTEYSELVLTLSKQEQGKGRPNRPVQADSLGKMQVQIDETEKRLRQTNSAYGQLAGLHDVTVSAVSRTLRQKEALLEYIRYRPVDFAAAHYGKEQYGVIVLRSSNKAAVAVKLGSATEIDDLIQQYRAEITAVPARLAEMEDSPNGDGLKQSEERLGRVASRLRDLLWTPLEAMLQGSTRVYVAPDGDLSLIPLEAFAKKTAGGEWHYLAEDLELVYLGTGRDLVDLASNNLESSSGARSAVLIGNPNFHEDPAEIANTILKLASPGDQPTKADNPLGTQATSEEFLSDPANDWYEVPSLGEILDRAKKDLDELGWSVTLHQGDEAVKEIALSVKAPAILQFATHGLTETSAKIEVAAWDNPLLHSILVLAGADTWNPERAKFYRIGGTAVNEAQARSSGLSIDQLDSARVRVSNGLLTAYEVTGMDLNGTELVNLTACETGLGKVTSEGVVGLRQAFRLAGARSIIVSLWQIPTEETISQVTNFYDLWLAGRQRDKPLKRYEAFHAAQLGALQHARLDHGASHPIYWAGTVYLGDPSDLPSLDQTKRASQ